MLAAVVAAAIACALLLEPLLGIASGAFTTADLLQGHPVLAAEQGWLPRNQLLSDPVVEFVPWLEFSRGELALGRFPLWNPHNGCGVPHWANFQSAVLSPFSVPFYVLPLKWALLASAFLKSWVAGAALLLFLRTLGLSRLASACGAIAFQASGHNALLIAYPHAGVAACVPAALLCVEKLVSGGGLRKWSLGLVVALVSMAYSGHPETLFFGAASIFAYALARLLPALRERTAATLRLAARLGALGLAAVLLAMPLVLPFLEYVQQSPRAFGLESTSHVALDLVHWPRYLFPDYLGTPVDRALVDPARPTPNYEIANLGYTSWLALVLALLALPAALRSGKTVSFALAALAWPLWAHDVLGIASGASSALGLGFIPSYVSQGAWALAIAVLAAHGVQHLSSANPTRSSPLLALALGLLALLFGCQSALEQLSTALSGTEDLAAKSHSLDHVAWIVASSLAAAAGMLVLLFAAGARARPVALLGLAVLLCAQTVEVFRPYQLVVPERLVYPRTTAVEMLARETAGERVLFVDPLGIPPHANLMYGLSLPTSYDALGIAEYNRLYGLLVEPRTAWQVATKASAHALAVLGVKYVALPADADGAPGPRWEGPRDGLELVAKLPGLALYRYAPSRGRFWLAPHAEARPGPRKALFRTAEPEVDPYDTVIVGPLVPEGFEPRKRGEVEAAGLLGSVVIAEEMPRFVRLEIECASPRYLVAALARYPGWSATLDGQPIEILDANTAFMAVDVPSGRHALEFIYDPASFRDGLWLALLGLSITIGLVLFRARSRPVVAP